MVKAIEVTKRYTSKEVKELAQLFLYLNNIEGLMDEYKYGVSAKWLWKLLNPLTKNNTPQRFINWRTSVSNISRLKEGEDYIIQETVTYETFDKKEELSWTEISVHDKKRRKVSGKIPVREVDYILTLRAGEYCATLTKGDSGDLYRRFIFDIKDEFIRLVFRWGKSIDSRIKFTTAISKLPFVQAMENKEQGKIYARFTNLVYEQLQDVEMTATDYKEKYGIAKREIAKHYFKKDGLLDLEELEKSLGTIISYTKPQSESELKDVFEKFFDSLQE